MDYDNKLSEIVYAHGYDDKGVEALRKFAAEVLREFADKTLSDGDCYIFPVLAAHRRAREIEGGK